MSDLKVYESNDSRSYLSAISTSINKWLVVVALAAASAVAYASACCKASAFESAASFCPIIMEAIA